MKKGYLLVEMITVLAVLAVIALPLSKLFKLAIYDIPESFKLVETNTSILDVLKYIRKDINSAIGFPQSFGKYTTSDKCILIEQQDKTVCYLAEQGKISRVAVGKEEGEITWQIPNGKIEWQIWRKDDTGYAVEIKKYVEQKSYDRTDKKMENSFLFFAGAFPEAVK